MRNLISVKRDKGRNEKNGIDGKGSALSRLFRSFRFFPYLSFFAVAVSILSLTTVMAADFGDISVKVEALSSGIVGNGYEEYRATIVNRSASQSHNVVLVTPAIVGRVSGAMISEMRRAVDVAPSTSASVSIFLPPLDIAGFDFVAIIDGQRQEEEVAIDVARSGAWVRRVSNRIYALVSRNVAKSGLMTFPGVEEGFKDPSGNIVVAYLPYEFPLDEWSRNWLGYTRFDAIVLSAEEMNEMSEPVRAALLQYIRAGGSAMIIGDWKVPEHWNSRKDSITALAEEDNERETESTQPDATNSLDRYYLGFGSLVVTQGVDATRISASQWSQISQLWGQSRVEHVYHSSVNTINKYFQIVDRIGIPLRGLFLLIILFVVLIGPVNLIWLARRKKKIWFLWTVPAISLATCLAISAFALFGEGLGATSRTESMTILDERDRQAATIGWTAFYSPVTPSDGLHFSYDTELMPQFPSYWESRLRGPGGRFIDWTNDQHLASGWITARIPSYFKFKKAESRRERLIVRREADGSLSVVNGLGAPIQNLWLADKSGKIHQAANIPAGAEARLTLTPAQAAGTSENLKMIYHKGRVYDEGDWLGDFKAAQSQPEQYLTSNSYLAVLDGGPFVEEALRSVKTRRAKSLVYGIQNED